MVRCLDEAHRPDNLTGKGWCPNATKLKYTDPEAIGYPDGRCCGWLYRCEKTGKVVVHNKICDAELLEG